MIIQSVFVGKELSPDDPVFRLNPYHQHNQQVHAIQAQLTVVRGAQNGDVFLLSSGINLFGRTEGRMLRDVLASRRHMQIDYKDRNFVLQDLGSTNGTYLNGKPVSQPVILHHGDVIRIGETILAFELSGKETAVLGYGAAPQRFADHSREEVTLQTRLLHQALTKTA